MNLIVKIKSIAIMAIIACAFCGCGSRSGNVVVAVPPAAETAQPTAKTLPFDADSAYRLIERQLDFGACFPRSRYCACATRGSDSLEWRQASDRQYNGSLEF